ncbi:MAG: hypothetical protein AAF432_04885 [Planctomycetota bacterium]
MMSSIHRLGLILAMLTLVLASSTAPARPIDDAVQLLQTLDSKILRVDYEETPLVDILDDMTERSGISIVADWNALDAIFVDPDDWVTVRSGSMTIAAVLDSICAQLGDEFDRPVIEATDGQVLMTSPTGAGKCAVLMAYDIRDLINDDASIQRLHDAQPDVPDDVLDDDPLIDDGKGEAIDDMPDEADDESAAEAAEPERELTPAIRLMELLAYHIDPEAWVEFGGSQAKISERDGVLLVTAPPSIHRDFADALRQLRRFQPSMVETTVVIVDVPAAEARRLVRRPPPSNRAWLNALLDVDGAELVWQGSLLSGLGDTARCDTNDTDGHHASVEMNWTNDTTSGRLSGALHLRFEEPGEQQRELKTTLVVPTGDNAVLLTLPGARSETTERRVLVLSESK